MSRTSFRPAINPDTHPAEFLRHRMTRSADIARFCALHPAGDPIGAGFAARFAAHDARALCRLLAATRDDSQADSLRAIVTEPPDHDEPRDDRPTLYEQADYSASLSHLRR